MKNTQNIIDRIKKSEQIISMIMGILVVLAIGGLVYRYFQKQQPTQQQKQQELEKEQELMKEAQDGDQELPTIHTVQAGENLWQIAEIYYQSGYNWVDISQANSLVNPELLEVGQELEIPDVDSKQITVDELPETGFGPEITDDKYTVTEGDSLSKIAQRAYGDMFSWPKIWSANRNQIHNPNVIEPGIVLEIPRD